MPRILCGNIYFDHSNFGNCNRTLKTGNGSIIGRGTSFSNPCYNPNVEGLKDKPINLLKPDRQTVRAALHDLDAELHKLYKARAPLMLVYGSYARGEESTNSDVDILLLYPQTIRPGQEIRRVSTILAQLNLRYQVLISILPVKESDYRQAPGVFWENLRKEGVPVEET